MFFSFFFFVFLFFFFFSSRRRHTSYIGDWSSDVCSSDLCWSTNGENTREGRDPCQRRVTELRAPLVAILTSISGAFSSIRCLTETQSEISWLIGVCRIRRFREIGRASCRETDYVSVDVGA